MLLFLLLFLHVSFSAHFRSCQEQLRQFGTRNAKSVLRVKPSIQIEDDKNIRKNIAPFNLSKYPNMTAQISQKLTRIKGMEFKASSEKLQVPEGYQKITPPLILPPPPKADEPHPLRSTVELIEIPPPPFKALLKKRKREPTREENGKSGTYNFANPPKKNFLLPHEDVKEDEKVLDFVQFLRFFSLDNFYDLFAEYVCVDTEATGLGDKHRMTEIGAVKMRNMLPTGEKFQILLNPEMEVSSYAHKLTGHTWKEHRKYPTFDDIANRFLKFIGDSPLIFHNAHYDLKLINESLKRKGHKKKIEDDHMIIDSYLYAKDVFPKGKNGLSALADKFGLERPGGGGAHGALRDSELLCQVFREIFKSNRSQFPKKMNRKLRSEFSILDFEKVKNNFGYDFFKTLGLRLDPPEQVRYCRDLYHPMHHNNIPAILFPFTSQDGVLKGYYVRYMLELEIKSPRHKNFNNSANRLFFGDPFNARIKLHGDDDAKTVVIGEITPSLLFRDSILSMDDGRIDCLGNNFNINAVLDLRFLPSLVFPQNTESLVILLEEDPNIEGETKDVLLSLIQRVCHPQYLPLSYLKKGQNINGWKAKYKGNTYKIIYEKEKCEDKQKAIFQIKDSVEELKEVCFSWQDQTIIIDAEIMKASCADFIISPPNINLKIVLLKSQFEANKTLPALYKNNPHHLVDRATLFLPVKSAKDLIFLERIISANVLYQDATELQIGSPGDKYLKNRGLQLRIPKNIKYVDGAFHYAANKTFPALVAPLLDENGRIVGVHRIFFDSDGKQVPKINGTPSKLTLGKSHAAYTPIYQGKYPYAPSESIDSLIISEGHENALVVREFFILLEEKDPPAYRDVLKRLGIRNKYEIRACVGVNGLLDMPVPKECTNVIIVADNDGDNVTVKQTMIEIAQYYRSKKNLQLTIALPQMAGREKLDVNDLYFQEGIPAGTKPILEMFKNALSVEDPIDMGVVGENMSTSMNKLRRKRADHFKAQEKYRKSMNSLQIDRTIDAIERALDELAISNVSSWIGGSC